MWFSTSPASNPAVQNEQERRASLLNRAQRTLLVVTFGGLAIHLLLQGISHPEVLLFFGGVFGVVFLSMGFGIVKQDRLATWWLCAGLWILISVLALVQGGTLPTVLQQYALLVVLSVLLLGVWETLGLSVFGLFTLLWLLWWGPVNPARETTLVLQASASLVASSLVFLFVLIVLLQTISLVQNTLRRGWEHTKELEVTGMSTSSMEAMLDGMAESLLVLDSFGRVIKANQATFDLLGYSERELDGRGMWTLCPRTLKKHDNALEILAPMMQEEVFYQHKSSRWIPVLLSVSVLEQDKHGQPRSLVCIASDLTLRKEVELELLQARRFAEEAEQARAHFLNSLSHQFKTPLNTILSKAHHVQSAVGENERSHSDMGRVLASANQLLSLLNNTLDLARLDSGRMTLTLETFPLEEMLTLFLEETEELRKDSENDFRLEVQDSHCFLYSDPSKVRKVLHHLLGNAFKFTRNGHIRMKVYKEERAGQPGVVLAIEDDGIGISSEQQQHIFQSFTQVDDSVTRLYQGTGIGLALCRQFTQMLGGSLELDSLLGRGSTFVCWFPSQQQSVHREWLNSGLAREGSSQS